MAYAEGPLIDEAPDQALPAASRHPSRLALRPTTHPTATAAVLAVSKQLGVGKESLRRWVAQAEVDAGDRPGVTSEELEETSAGRPRTGGCVRTWRS
jgi:hypothetical protein